MAAVVEREASGGFVETVEIVEIVFVLFPMTFSGLAVKPKTDQTKTKTNTIVSTVSTIPFKPLPRLVSASLLQIASFSAPPPRLVSPSLVPAENQSQNVGGPCPSPPSLDICAISFSLFSCFQKFAMMQGSPTNRSSQIDQLRLDQPKFIGQFVKSFSSQHRAIS